jgi:hypothetical protein
MSESDRSAAPRGRRRLLAVLVAVVLVTGGAFFALGLTPSCETSRRQTQSRQVQSADRSP